MEINVHAWSESLSKLRRLSARRFANLTPPHRGADLCKVRTFVRYCYFQSPDHPLSFRKALR